MFRCASYRNHDIELEMYEAAIDKKAFENVFATALEIVLE